MPSRVCPPHPPSGAWEGVLCLPPYTHLVHPTNQSADCHQAHATSQALWSAKTQRWVRQTNLWPLGAHRPLQEADAGGKMTQEARGLGWGDIPEQQRPAWSEQRGQENSERSLCAGQLVAPGRAVPDGDTEPVIFTCTSVWASQVGKLRARWMTWRGWRWPSF